MRRLSTIVQRVTQKGDEGGEDADPADRARRGSINIPSRLLHIHRSSVCHEPNSDSISPVVRTGTSPLSTRSTSPFKSPLGVPKPLRAASEMLSRDRVRRHPGPVSHSSFKGMASDTPVESEELGDRSGSFDAGSPRTASSPAGFDSPRYGSQGSGPASPLTPTTNGAGSVSTPGSPLVPFPNRTAAPAPAAPSVLYRGADFLNFNKERLLRFTTKEGPMVDEWLKTVASHDPKQRFPATPMQLTYQKLRDTVAERRPQWQAHGLTESQAWALLTYSAELYNDASCSRPTESCASQLYAAVDTVCCELSHTSNPSETLREEWALFVPLVVNIDAAIRALPKVPTALLRGLPPINDPLAFLPGTKGGWGCFSAASSSVSHSPSFVTPQRSLHAPLSNHFLLLTDAARSVAAFSLFPDEGTHLHPLGTEWEVGRLWLEDVLQAISYRGFLIPLRRAGCQLPLSVFVDALTRTRFVYDAQLKKFFYPLAVEDPFLVPTAGFCEKVEAFVASSSNVLVVASKPGMGKTMCALALARRVQWLGRLWVYLQLPAMEDPFAPHAVVTHLLHMLCMREGDLARGELQRQPLVLLLDSLDEVTPPPPGTPQDLWQLNGFGSWNVKLVVMCRQSALRGVWHCLGPDPVTLYLRGFTATEAANLVRIQSNSNTPQALSRQLFSHLPPSAMLKGFCSPLWLSLATDVFMTRNASLPFQSEADLFKAWSQAWFEGTDAPEHTQEVAEEIAWQMMCQGQWRAPMSDRYQQGTFRCCPMRVSAFGPKASFSFWHSTLRDFFAACYLYRKLDCLGAEKQLDCIDLSKHTSVLQLFGGILQGSQPAAGGNSVERRLFQHVLASKGEPATSPAARRAAVSLSLLTLARVSLQGRDLGLISAPKAILQCADLRNANLSQALLRGADLRGAILDGTNLRGADLTDAYIDELVRMMDGHFFDVQAVVLSADGNAVVSCSSDRTICMWHAATGEPIRTFSGHRDVVNCVALSGDGSTIVSSSRDRTIRIWKVATGQPQLTRPSPPFAIASVAISADGSVIVFGGDDPNVLVCDSEQQMRPLTGGAAATPAVAVSADGKTIATGSKDKIVRVYGWKSGNLQRELKGHSAAITSLAVSSGGQFVVSGSEDDTIRIWNMPQGVAAAVLQGHNAAITCVALSSDSTTIVSGSQDKEIRVWRRSTGTELHRLQGHNKAVTSVATSSDGNVIVSGGQDAAICLWKISQGDCLHYVAGHTKEAKSVSLSPDGMLGASASADTTARVWDTTRGEPVSVFAGHKASVSSVAMSSNKAVVVTGSLDALVSVWDANTGKLLHNIDRYKQPVCAVGISFDMQRIASATDNGTVYVWHAAAGTLICTLAGHLDAPHSVSFSRDTLVLASASPDSIWIWNLSTRACIRSILTAQLPNPVTCMALAPNGETVIAGFEDAVLRIYGTAGGGPVRELLAHAARISAVAFSPNGGVMASGSADRTVRLWSMATGEVLYVLEGHADIVTGVSVTDECRAVLSASYDFTLRFWEPATGSCKVWRSIGEETPVSFATRCAINLQTLMPSSLKRRLVQLGATVETPST